MYYHGHKIVTIINRGIYDNNISHTTGLAPRAPSSTGRNPQAGDSNETPSISQVCN